MTGSSRLAFHWTYASGPVWSTADSTRATVSRTTDAITAVDRLSLTGHAGTVIRITGSSGAGKSGRLVDLPAAA